MTTTKENSVQLALQLAMEICEAVAESLPVADVCGRSAATKCAEAIKLQLTALMDAENYVPTVEQVEKLWCMSGRHNKMQCMAALRYTDGNMQKAYDHLMLNKGCH